MLTLIVGTTNYSLDDGSICRLVGYDGWGMSPNHRLAERGPLQHGETDLGYRLDPRFGKLVLQLEKTELADMYDPRASLIAMFSPANNPKLRWSLPNGDVRQFDCHYAGDLSMPWNPKDWAAPRFALTLKCPDPTCYDPNSQFVNFYLTGGGTPWAIPWPIPWLMGTSTLNQTVAINYPGSFLAYPYIRIGGPITSPSLTNETTGEILAFMGITIGAGSYYDIDCRYGYKTIKNEAGTNKIADLSTDSDLATFHIAAANEAVGGINSFRVAGASVNTQTYIYMTYFVRYLGL